MKKVLVLTGRGDSDISSDSFEILDLSGKNQNYTGCNFAFPYKYSRAVGTLIDSKYPTVCTFTNSKDCNCFAFEGNEWNCIGSGYEDGMKSRWGRASAYVPNIGWWVTGGSQDGHIRPTAETSLYSQDNGWAEGPNLYHPNLYHCMVQLDDDVTTMIIGGQGPYNSENGVSTVLSFNWETKAWTREYNLKQERSNPACAVDPLSGNAVVAGGISEDSAGHYITLSSVEIFDRSTGYWFDGPELPVPLTNHRIVRNATSMVLIGGEDDTNVKDSIYMFTPHEWVLIGNLKDERKSHVAMFIPDSLLADNCNHGGAIHL